MARVKLQSYKSYFTLRTIKLGLNIFNFVNFCFDIIDKPGLFKDSNVFNVPTPSRMQEKAEISIPFYYSGALSCFKF